MHPTKQPFLILIAKLMPVRFEVQTRLLVWTVAV